MLVVIGYYVAHTGDIMESGIFKSMLNALKPFRAERKNMPLQYVAAFMHVASEEGLNVTEYAKRAGVSQSLMTRHLQDLGEVNRHHEDGMGFVEADGDLMDRRNSLIRLTAKGKKVAREISEAFARLPRSTA